MKKQTKDAINALSFMGAMLLYSIGVFLVAVLACASGMFVSVSWLTEHWGGSNEAFFGAAIVTLPFFAGIAYITQRLHRRFVVASYGMWLWGNRNSEFAELMEEYYLEAKKEFEK